MDVVYSTDNNYIKYIAVSLVSLLYNTPAKILNVHILCQDVNENSKKALEKQIEGRKNIKINFYDINSEAFSQFKYLSTYPGITLPAYFRLHLSSILTDVETALYLDGDTIINAPLDKLFEYNISDYYLAGVPDINCRVFESIHKKYQLQPNTYINSGVVLFNLKKIREDHCENELDKFIGEIKNDIKFGDQDILNLFYANKVFKLPDEYNVHGTNFFNRNTYNKPIIIHHVCKAWVFGQKTYYQSRFIKYIRFTNDTFKPKSQGIIWLIASDIVAFFKTIFNPKKLFSYEYLYGIYKYTLRRMLKK